MKQGPINMKQSSFLAICSLTLVVSCSPGSIQEHDEAALPKYVVLTHTEFTGGPIAGGVLCRDDAGRAILSGQCFTSYQVLQDAVFACGPAIVTIDRSFLHGWSVAFPVDWKPGKPSPLDVVRCVQGNVGFSFSAVIAPPPTPGEFPGGEGDPKPFLPLYRK